MLRRSPYSCSWLVDSKFGATTVETSLSLRVVSSVEPLSPVVRSLRSDEPAAFFRWLQLGLLRLNPESLGRASSARFGVHDLLISASSAVPPRETLPVPNPRSAS